MKLRTMAILSLLVLPTSALAQVDEGVAEVASQGAVVAGIKRAEAVFLEEVSLAMTAGRQRAGFAVVEAIRLKANTETQVAAAQLAYLDGAVIHLERAFPRDRQPPDQPPSQPAGQPSEEAPSQEQPCEKKGWLRGGFWERNDCVEPGDMTQQEALGLMLRSMSPAPSVRSAAGPILRCSDVDPGAAMRSYIAAVREITGRSVPAHIETAASLELYGTCTRWPDRDIRVLAGAVLYAAR